MEKPRACHLLITKRILTYIKGTVDHGILISYQKNIIRTSNAYGYSESDYGGYQNDRVNIIGNLFTRDQVTKDVLKIKYCKTEL